MSLADLLNELRAKAWASARRDVRNPKPHTAHVCWRAAEKIEELDSAPHGYVPVGTVREVFTRHLNLSRDQRAYSWHEIQDALSEIESARQREKSTA